MNARRSRWLVVAVLALAACRKAGQGGPAKAEPPPPIHVTTTTVVTRPMPRDVPLTGILAAGRSSDVAANAAGKVVAAPIERGTSVKEGALLAQLDTRSAYLSAKEASAAMQLAQATLDQAKTDCERAESLLKSGAITEAEYEKQKVQCTTGNLSVAEAEARRDAAAKLLGDAAIRAPFAGIVAERFIDVGEYVSAITKVARVVSIDPIRLDLGVPESDVRFVSEGMEVTFQVSAFPDQSFVAKIKFIGAELREPSRDLLVEATSPNVDGKLRPNMFAVARLQLPPEKALAVPSAALRSDGTTERAFVVDDQGVIIEHIVETGAKDGEFVEIRKGLAEGDSIVSPLTAAVKDGARTKDAPPSAAPSDSATAGSE